MQQNRVPSGCDMMNFLQSEGVVNSLRKRIGDDHPCLIK